MWKTTLIRITLHTDYALRVLMFLAAEPDKLHTIEEVSVRLGISRNHRMKVAQTLVQGGFVEGVRGKSGGLRLGTSPESINRGIVVRTTEDGFNPVECFDHDVNRCVISKVCERRGRWKRHARHFFAFWTATAWPTC